MPCHFTALSGKAGQIPNETIHGKPIAVEQI